MFLFLRFDGPHRPRFDSREAEVAVGYVVHNWEMFERPWVATLRHQFYRSATAQTRALRNILQFQPASCLQLS